VWPSCLAVLAARYCVRFAVSERSPGVGTFVSMRNFPDNLGGLETPATKSRAAGMTPWLMTLWLVTL
jgi:hypothetical protein